MISFEDPKWGKSPENIYYAIVDESEKVVGFLLTGNMPEPSGYHSSKTEHGNCIRLSLSLVNRIGTFSQPGRIVHRAERSRGVKDSYMKHNSEDNPPMSVLHALE